MIDRILIALKNNGYEVKASENRIITNHIFNDTKYQISGDISRNFPYTLPNLYLLERSKYGSLAHVGWFPSDKYDDEGLICGGVKENRHIDYNDLENVYLLALKKAEDTLNEMFANPQLNNKEVIKEFSAHWDYSFIDDRKVINFVNYSDDIIEITPFKSNDAILNKINYFRNLKEKDLNSNYAFYKRLSCKSIVDGKGIYIPLSKAIIPPKPGEKIMDWYRVLLNSLDSSTNNSLKTMSRHLKSKVFWILASFKIDIEKHSWFCIKFENETKSLAPLTIKALSTGWSSKAYTVNTHNNYYLVNRGGADNSLTDKSIAIIGCGSIGSEVARQLASLGVQKLLLIDYDEFSIDNIQRHVLNPKYIGKEKTKALQDELHEKYPYLTVGIPKYKKLKECLKAEFLKSIDGIIVATGSPTDERYFNENIFRLFKFRPWIIYSWTEGHSYGGHAIYIHPTGSGCIDCLYRDDIGNRSLQSIQNFIESNQNLTIDISGCGTHFLPYSNLDAIQSALITTRLVTYAVNNKLEESSRISWKNPIPENDDILTTYRYKKFNNSLSIDKLHWENCETCR